MSYDVKLLDVSPYAEDYGLDIRVLALKMAESSLDLNVGGLIMHGSTSDPYTILRYGLIPHNSDGPGEDHDWQVCLGISSYDPDVSLSTGLARKNPAVKYADYLKGDGIIYVLSEDVKLLDGYSEYGERGQSRLAWMRHPIPAKYIMAVVAADLARAAAAIYACDCNTQLYDVDNHRYLVESL